MRGEYAPAAWYFSRIWELPPRARRILCEQDWDAADSGTTSACAENTSLGTPAISHTGNYLRVRGEYHVSMKPLITSKELPPRARRIPSRLVNSSRRRGTTSACAENTPGCSHGIPSCWNYLRVRGEYSAACGGIRILWELPPRARRIPLRICRLRP